MGKIKQKTESQTENAGYKTQDHDNFLFTVTVSTYMLVLKFSVA